MGTGNTVRRFLGEEPLKIDINHRKFVVAAAKSVKFAFGLPEKSNAAFWTNLSLVANGKTAFDAVDDIFKAQNKDTYKMACLRGAGFVHLRGASQALAKDDFNELVGRMPFGLLWRVKKSLQQPNFKNGQYDPDNDNNAKWVPGDWGYIASADTEGNLRAKWGDDWGLYAGENVIYLGGKDGGNFETSLAKFKGSAYFWGHGLGTQSFGDWIKSVEMFNNAGKAEIKPWRDGLRQHLLTCGSLVSTDVKLTEHQFKGGLLTIGGDQYKVVDNYEDLVVTEKYVAVVVKVGRAQGDNFIVKQEGKLSLLAGADDLGTSFLGYVDLAMKKNEYRNYRVLVADQKKNPYTIKSNTFSNIVTQEKVTIPFMLTDVNNNKTNGNIVQLKLDDRY